jgi:hypothetical protein
VKQTTVRINRVSVRLRGESAPIATRVSATVAEQLARRVSVHLPQVLQNDLAGRLAGALPGARRK